MLVALLVRRLVAVRERRHEDDVLLLAERRDLKRGSGRGAAGDHDRAVTLDHALRVVARDRRLRLIVADRRLDLHAHDPALGVDLVDREIVGAELILALVGIVTRLRHVEPDGDFLRRRGDDVGSSADGERGDPGGACNETTTRKGLLHERNS